MQSAQQLTSIRLEIQKIKHLPPLPVIAQQLLGALNNEDTSIAEIAEIINQDPSLTSRITGLANSAFFGFGRRLYAMDEAIINLGLDLVRSLALTMVVGGVFDIKKCKGFDIARYWLSALLTADLAKRSSNILSSSIKISNGQLFLYGLLHNLGVLILTDRFPKLMSEIFKVAKRHPERRLIYTEQAMLDTDHHQAGSWLAHKWNLPDEVIAVIEHHHNPEYTGDHKLEVLLIGFCSRTTRHWILDKETLISDEDEVLSTLSIDKKKMEIIAKKCRSRHEEYQGIAQQMGT